MLLVYFGWADFVKNGSRGDGSRNNLIDANREGLLSCLGYTGLFLVASHLGTIIFKSRYCIALQCYLQQQEIFSFGDLFSPIDFQFPYVITPMLQKIIVVFSICRTKAGLLKQLILIDAILWLATIFCNGFIDKVSRQMANLSYILWIVS